jgi:chromosome segregation ATPase
MSERAGPEELEAERVNLAIAVAAYRQEHARLTQAITNLNATGGKLEQSVHQATAKAVQAALVQLKTEADAAAHAMQGLQRFTLRRGLTQHFATALAAMVITLIAVWWYVPGVSEMNALRAERTQLQSSITELTRRGGRIVMADCGGRLCIAASNDQGQSVIDWRRAWLAHGVPMVIPKGY